jgi:nucleoside-triphosphatase
VGKAFLLTGRPGSGKTTVIRAVAAKLGKRAAGFYTAEIREGGRRVGFRLVTVGLEPVQEGLLARVGLPSRHRVGRYGVQLADLERLGVGAILRAVEEPDVVLVVIDEIGKMELFSAAFREAVERAFSSPKAVLATVMAGRHPWVEAIKLLPGLFLTEVTPQNRDALPDRIVDWLRTTFQSSDSLLDV